MRESRFEHALRCAPSAIRPFLLGTLWERPRLWALELPVTTLPTDELAPLLELPWWRDGDRFFAVSPRAVLTDPARYPEHDKRIAAADLGYPIHVTTVRGRLTILDGVHRLARAVRERRQSIDVQFVSPGDHDALLPSVT